mgnify:CR=1 FL=1
MSLISTIHICDVSLPLWWWIIPPVAIFGFYFIEVMVFWLLTKKLFKLEIKFSKIFGVVILANMVTSIIGTFTVSLYFIMYFHLFILAFLLSVFVEWLIILQFFRQEIGAKSLMVISVIMNTASYLTLALVLFFMGILFSH